MARTRFVVHQNTQICLLDFSEIKEPGAALAAIATMEQAKDWLVAQ